MNTASKELHRDRVLLGFSGGVDSTAAALLLRKAGYSVTGLFFDVHKEKSPNAKLAEKTASELGIPFIYRNVHEDFSKEIIDYFCREYQVGRTPNPCVMCNPTIKFPVLLEEADAISAYHIATGHYAGIHHDDESGLYYIKQAENLKKDQSYMLYRLGQDVLSRLIFPLNQVEDKEQTREIARKEGAGNADRKDSQEICFLPEDQNYIRFLKEKGLEAASGNFIDGEGNILGIHQGITHYTIGQRKGLGKTFGKPVYVTKVDHNNNTVTLGNNEELFISVVRSENHAVVLGSGQSLQSLDGTSVEAKIRYTAKKAAATLRITGNGIVETHFVEKQRAATPGQSIVFYKDNLVLGGGIIV